MADKNKGRLGGLLGQRTEEGDSTGDARPTDPPSQPDQVLAYEEDWYRSLKALAERQAELEAQQQGDEQAAAPAETALAAPQPEAGTDAQGGGPPPASTEASTDHHAALAGPAPVVEQDEEAAQPEQPSAENVIIHLEPGQTPSTAPAEPAETRPVASAETAATAAGPSLTSTDAAERRAAMAAMAGRGLSDAEADQVAALLLDPDREIRCLSLEALRGRAERVEDAAVRQALQDPTDEVRAAAVRLAAARGTRDLAELVSVVGARRWPHMQATVLELLPGLIRSGGPLGEEDLSSLLSAVAQVESAPLDPERHAFAELARAVGTSRLVEALSLPDGRRLGAVRLLMAEGSAAVLRAVAPYASDPLEEVRKAATSAAELVAELDREESTARHRAEAEGLAGVEQAAEAEMITALARALQDPDQAVRGRARTALTEIKRAVISDWVQGALHAEDAEVAGLAAGVAELIGLSEVAPLIMERSLDLAADVRGPFVGALASFGMDPAVLVGKLSGMDASRRPEAVRVLWQVLGLAALPQLRSSLTDSSGPVRMAVLEVFGESDAPSAVEVAKGVLESDSSPAVRATAVQVLGRAGMEQRLASLAQALLDPDPDVRATAVEVLPEGLGRDAAHLLVQALGDLDERVWQAAVRHVAAFTDQDLPEVWSALRRCHPDQRAELIAALERGSADKLARMALDHLHSPDVEERVLSVEMAGRAGTQSSVEATIQAMQDPAAPVRRAAAASLALLRSPASVAALGKALSDPDPEIRMGAVRALGVIDDEQVLGFLVTALKDPEIRVRQVASEVLTQWSSPAVAKRLAGVLSVPNLRDAAAELLAKMGPSAVELLIDVLMQATPEIVPTVGQLLSNIVGIDRFIERLSSMEPDQRLRAAEAVGAIGGTMAVDALIGTLSDPDERIRIRSVQLLGRLGDARALEAVKRCLLGDPVPEVVVAAEEAVSRLGGSRET